jgi:hypothetical protein
MSVLDDFRKLAQDFLAPELRAINARLDGMEKLNEVRFEQTYQRIESLSKEIQANHEAVIRELATDKRISRLEDRLAAQQSAQ